MAEHFGKAGAGARKMAKKRVIVIYGTLFVFLILGFLGVLLYHKLQNMHVPLLPWLILGFAAGLVITVAMVLTDDKEDPDKFIDRAFQGAEGEEKVELLLSSLPDTYSVFHDLPCPLGNIDHIVVGPTGVFVIETKSHRGNIVVSSDGQLMRNGRPLEKDVVKQVWRQTFWLKETLESRLGETVFIHPFLVFVNGFVRVRNPVKGVTILPGKWLVESMTKKPNRLTEQQVDAVRQVLQALHSAS